MSNKSPIDFTPYTHLMLESAPFVVDQLITADSADLRGLVEKHDELLDHMIEYPWDDKECHDGGILWLRIISDRPEIFGLISEKARADVCKALNANIHYTLEHGLTDPDLIHALFRQCES